MGTFGGSGTFGGLGGGGASAAGVLLSSVLAPMLRIAGITTLPGTTPGVDQTTELVPMVNDMLDSWSCDGHKIFTASISDPLPLTAGKKVYTIGNGADFDLDRPQFIKGANLLFPTSPVVRREVQILDDDEWRAIAIQDIVGAPPFQLYYDGGMDANGWAQIYLRFQPTAGYSLELYTWQALQSGFVSSSDIAIFPKGYVEAIKWHGALRVAAMYPLESKLSPIAAEMAQQALHTLMVLNMSSPRISCESGLDREAGGDVRPWLTGNFR